MARKKPLTHEPSPAGLKGAIARGRARAFSFAFASLIPTSTPPPCVRCRQIRTANWNGRLPDAQQRAMTPPTLAVFYVRAKNTLGLYRHLCRDCQAATGDTIVAEFVAP